MKYLAEVAACALFALVLTACGDEEPSTAPADSVGESSAAEAEFPVTVGSGENAVEITAQPERIVSLSPTATEMLFAVGAGDQVEAADEYSNYPEDAPTTDLSGFQPNVEAIVSYQPDLVVAESDPGQLVASLSEVGVPTLILPSATSLDDTYAQIEQVGAATGHVGDAAELVSQMRTEIDEIVAGISNDEEITYFHELDPNLFTVTSSTFIGELYDLIGMRSIADDAGDSAGDYPQLSPEFILNADPDIIFYADSADAGVTAESIAQRPGWGELTAVRDGHVVEVDKDIASRWGPRVVDFLRFLADQRAQLELVG